MPAQRRLPPQKLYPPGGNSKLRKLRQHVHPMPLAPIGRDAYASRIAVPIWADFMKRTARALPANEFVAPRGLRDVELCSISYLKPVDGCPVYTEYFKDGDDIPTRLCNIHSGNMKQRAQRAIQGLFGALGKGIKGIFR